MVVRWRRATAPAAPWPLPAGLGVARSPAVDGIRPGLAHVQLEGAGVILRHLEIPAIPERLRKALYRYDLDYALTTFLSDLGLRAVALLQPAHPDHPPARERLRWACRHLDWIESEAGSDSATFDRLYVLLREELARAEEQFAVYRRAKAIRDLLAADAVPFPVYKAFRSECLAALDRWGDLTGDQCEEIQRVRGKYLDLLGNFSDLMSGFQAHARKLRGSRKLGDEQRDLLEDIAAEGERIESHILAGVVPPEEGVELLREVANDLAALMEAIYDVDEDDLEAHLKALELEPPSTLEQVTKAWKEKIREVHPDLTGGDGEAAKNLNAAYYWLKGYYTRREKRGEEVHV
ncbi:MAG: hypothetical protein JNN08_00155 [Bryobacterales bacterium]|nr:hypothetical protein [Bryobacterales bacterium]